MKIKSSIVDAYWAEIDKKNKDGLFEKIIVQKLKYCHSAPEDNYSLIKIQTRGLSLNKPILLITAGLHGDEPIGPLTIQDHVREIFDYAYQRGVAVVIYPLVNPSGFEKQTRYNIDGHYGDAGNNDFVRYRLSSGEIVDHWDNEPASNWYWSDNPRLKVDLPLETRALQRDLRRLPLASIQGVLDLHTDNYAISPGCYAYNYTKIKKQEIILNRIEKIVPILKNHLVNSAENNQQYFLSEVVQGGSIVCAEEDLKTDRNGMINLHDGSITDLFDRLGVRNNLAIEVNLKTNFPAAKKVNLFWIFGIIDIISREV